MKDVKITNRMLSLIISAGVIKVAIIVEKISMYIFLLQFRYLHIV